MLNLNEKHQSAEDLINQQHQLVTSLPISALPWLDCANNKTLIVSATLRE